MDLSLQKTILKIKILMNKMINLKIKNLVQNQGNLKNRAPLKILMQ